MATVQTPDLAGLMADAIAHHRAGRLGKAEAAYRAVLEMLPENPLMTHNLGIIAAARGELDDAIRCFEAAIAAEPDYASAHFNRAAALDSLGRSRDAIAGFSRASALEPGCYEAHRALGFLWLAQGERGRALDHFARTYELRRGEDRSDIAIASLSVATRLKLLHDAEQFHFLAARRRDPQRFTALARAYEAAARDFPEEPTRLSREQMATLGDDYNTAINVYAASELPARAVTEREDREDIMRRFGERQGGAVYFDDLLTPPALARLKAYLLESTIWHDFKHIRGFLASYLEDGLACPLLLQVGDEVRRTFPELLASRPLSQAWAFKGLEAASAVEAHADDAAISLNFWLTPDAANLDRPHGGLAVCRMPQPLNWQIKGYDVDSAEVAEFMAQHAEHTLYVPYRENRGVLFESRLFHRSDAPRFAQGYENHRINITMLFGRHEN